MKKALLLVTAMLTVGFSVHANDTAPISLQDYARHAQFIDVKISPQGKYLAATSRNEEGGIRLTVLDINSRAVLSATELRGNESVNTFNWVSDDRLLMTMAREVGALDAPIPTGELFAMDANGSRRVILTGPRSRDGERVISSVVDWLPDNPREVLISSYSMTSQEPWLDIYKMRVDSGRKRSEGRIPLRARRGTSVQVITDSGGEPRVAVGVDPERNNQIITMVREGRSNNWSELMRHNENEGGFSPLAFTASQNLLMGLSDRDSDTRAISLLNIETGEEEILAVHPGTDLMPIFSINKGRPYEVIGAAYEYEGIDAVFFDGLQDAGFSRVVQSLMATFPGRSVGVNSATHDNKQMILTVSGANHPRQFFLFDTEKTQLTELAAATPWLNNPSLPETQTIVYKSRDGLDIHALLTLPKGQTAEDLPLIMLPHGGPHGIRDSVTYMDPDAKVLAQNGYAVLQPNFRGSGGFGREFLEAGYRNWGTSMINDMTDGVLHLAEQGIINKSRVCAYGASYGGYAALMSAVREPDLYKCTVGFVGVYDLDLMFTDGDIPQGQAGVNFLNTVLPQDSAGRRAQSPLHNLDKLKAPVFIIHGGRDVRVPVVQAERLREALEEREHPYEWMLKENEGHGFYKPDNNVERWQKMLAFFNKHIGEAN